MWLGERDVDESIKTARASDPHTGRLVAVMSAWAAELIVDVGYRVSELVTDPAEVVTPAGAAAAANAQPLGEALFAVAADKTGQLDVTKLGNWLRDRKNRVIGKHKLIKDDKDAARPRWKLELK